MLYVKFTFLIIDKNGQGQLEESSQRAEEEGGFIWWVHILRGEGNYKYSFKPSAYRNYECKKEEKITIYIVLVEEKTLKLPEKVNLILRFMTSEKDLNVSSELITLK